jgi:hypothetical protein
MRMTPVALVVVCAAALLPQPIAWGWYTQAHQLIARTAVQDLPASMPKFFTDAAAAIADCAVDPDYFRDRSAPQMSSSESPEHYLDSELLGDHALPPTRYEFLHLCYSLNLAPEHVGTLPYSVTEWTQKLMMAFAQHRKWPEDKAIQGKCLVYAGILGHYAGDLCQPLHCTMHFDGRADATGHLIGVRGIHAKVDALLERPEIDAAWATTDMKVAAYPEVFPAVVAEIGRSRALVEKVYALEPVLPAADQNQDTLTIAPELLAFEKERFRTAVGFVASLYLTAWEKSAKINVPDWVEPGGGPSHNQQSKGAASR